MLYNNTNHSTTRIVKWKIINSQIYVEHAYSGTQIII